MRNSENYNRDMELLKEINKRMRRALSPQPHEILERMIRTGIADFFVNAIIEGENLDNPQHVIAYSLADVQRDIEKMRERYKEYDDVVVELIAVFSDTTEMVVGKSDSVKSYFEYSDKFWDYCQNQR